jgi:hypothetical protein
MNSKNILFLLLLHSFFCNGCKETPKSVVSTARDITTANSSLTIERDIQNKKTKEDRKNSIDAEPLVQQAIINVSLCGDGFEIEAIFRSYPEETIKQLKAYSNNNLDTGMAAILGKLLAINTKVSGEKWINDNMTGVLKNYAMIGYGSELAVNDMTAFNKLIANMAINNARDCLIAKVVAKLSETDVKEACQLAYQEYSVIAAGKSPALGAISSQLTYKMVNSLSESDLRDMIFQPEFGDLAQKNGESVACMISEKYPELALSWVADKDFNNNIKEKLLSKLLRTKLEIGNEDGISKALEEYSSMVPDIEPTESLIKALTSKGQTEEEEYDFIKCQGWIKCLAESSLTPEIYKTYARSFAEADLDAVESWVNILEVGRNRDFAIFGITEILSKQDTQRAIDWSDKIADETIRKDALNTIQGSR